jgi:hypothetical protein
VSSRTTESLVTGQRNTGWGRPAAAPSWPPPRFLDHPQRSPGVFGQCVTADHAQLLISRAISRARPDGSHPGPHSHPILSRRWSQPGMTTEHRTMIRPAPGGPAWATNNLPLSGWRLEAVVLAQRWQCINIRFGRPPARPWSGIANGAEFLTTAYRPAFVLGGLGGRCG